MHFYRLECRTLRIGLHGLVHTAQHKTVQDFKNIPARSCVGLCALTLLAKERKQKGTFALLWVFLGAEINEWIVT